MINQRNVEKVRLDFWMDWKTAAKLRTVVRGQTMPAYVIKDRKRRKEVRPMTVGYFVETLISERLATVEPDAEAVKWMLKGRESAVKIRKAQDALVKSGVNRKPKSEWKKPGRVAGKIYPKYEAAMKRVAERRRIEAEKRKAEKASK